MFNLINKYKTFLMNISKKPNVYMKINFIQIWNCNNLVFRKIYHNWKSQLNAKILRYKIVLPIKYIQFLPILVQMTTIKQATGWLSSRSNVLTDPSNILTRRCRNFLLYSRRSPFRRR